MGGILVNDRMESRIPGLFAAGEAMGGANGANRLSGNAIPEALVFGERAGIFAAARAADMAQAWNPGAAAEAVQRIRERAAGQKGDTPAIAVLEEMRELMWRQVGPFRTGVGLATALERLGEMRALLPRLDIAPDPCANPTLADWFELRGSLIAAEAVARAATGRTESRGAHQREDFPEVDPRLAGAQRVRMDAAGAITAEFAA
jgi:succinate dehydrogenase/fumarate reductase flavoprotein subunit